MLLGVFSPVLGNRFGGYSAEGGWVGCLCGVGVGVEVGVARMWWLELLCHSLPVLFGTETEVPTWTCRLLKIQVPSCGHTNVGHICEQLDIAFRSDNHGVLRTPAPPHYLPQAHSRSELL